MDLKDRGCVGRTIGQGRFEKYMEFMNINDKQVYIPEAGGKAGYGMEDYRDIEERLSEGRKDYEHIPVPDEMRTKVEAGIMRARTEKEGQAMKGREEGEEKEKEREKEREGEKRQEESRAGKDLGGSRKNMKRNKKKTMKFRIAAAVAAAAAVLIILPNTGAGVAYAMGSIPVVGKLFQAVTFRDYQYESDRFDANVEVPQIVVDDMAGDKEEDPGQKAGEKGAEGQNKEEVSGELQGTVEQINFDIEEVTNRLIEEFQASADLGESYGTLEIHHETVTNNDRYFTLKLSIYQGAGSGYESYKFYTIDKRTGKQVQLGDLFQEGTDYNERLSENIKDQMRAEMAEDENKIYWVDYEDVPGWNFEKLKEDQNFYFDEAGNIVISFDEYEVAPGYMGALEFTVERAVFEDILK